MQKNTRPNLLPKLHLKRWLYKFFLKERTELRSFSLSLSTSEWILSMSLFGFLLSLLIISKITSFRDLDRIKEIRPAKAAIEILSVEISGCVQKPGVYQLLKGTTLRLALRKARPKPFADLSRVLELNSSCYLEVDTILEESCRIEIGALEEVRIQVEGFVRETLSLVLPAGSRICDLKNRVELTPEADQTFLRRRRMLKDGEVVKVPGSLEKKRRK